MQYKIVEHLTPEKLCEDVEELLNNGWKLHGTLILASHCDPASRSEGNQIRTLYLQALTTEQDCVENVATVDENELVDALA